MDTFNHIHHNTCHSCLNEVRAIGPTKPCIYCHFKSLPNANREIKQRICDRTSCLKPAINELKLCESCTLQRDKILNRIKIGYKNINKLKKKLKEFPVPNSN